MAVRVDLSKIENSFVHDYAAYTQWTESPSLFHLWCGLSGISACLGRRVFVQMGLSPVYANMYVVLVGPPGVRKSTATAWTRNCLKSATNIRWAPDDTSGQRQGLLRAFTETDEDETSVQFEVDQISKIGDLQELQKVIEKAEFKNRQPEKSVLYGMFGELDSFIGTNQREFLTFLRRVWDGDDYTYRLRSEEIVLREPLLSFVAASTPEDVAESLPPGSMGSGFCSRIIFVFSDAKNNRLHRPPSPDPVLQGRIEDTFKHLFNYAEGEIKINQQADRLLKTIYEHPKESLDDPRFVYYQQRRYTHLLKLAMILSMARRSNVIAEVDVYDADYILTQTELDMPLAMGEFGLSPLAKAQQKVLDYVKFSSGVVQATKLWAHMQRDLKARDFEAAVQNLVNAGKIKKRQHKDYGALYVYQRPKWEQTDGRAKQESRLPSNESTDFKSGPVIPLTSTAADGG